MIKGKMNKNGMLEWEKPTLKEVIDQEEEDRAYFKASLPFNADDDAMNNVEYGSSIEVVKDLNLDKFK